MSLLPLFLPSLAGYQRPNSSTNLATATATGIQGSSTTTTMGASTSGAIGETFWCIVAAVSMLWLASFVLWI